MGTKNNPGKFDCYEAADPDEPMFILLGRDPDAPALVRRWATVRRMKDEDPAKVYEARLCARAMEDWRAAHQPAKNPDPSLYDRVQFMIDWADKQGYLPDHCWTFPDGETWHATKLLDS